MKWTVQEKGTTATTAEAAQKENDIYFQGRPFAHLLHTCVKAYLTFNLNELIWHIHSGV